MASPKHPTSFTTTFLDQPPSCLQFCPATPENFIVGTYLLFESKSEDGSITQTKTGSLQLWNLDPVTVTLTQIQRISLPHAVFDLHFHPSNPSLLAIATSAGEVSLFTISPTTITPLWTKQVHEDAPAVSALYLAWTPEYWLQPPLRDGFAVTFADGRTSVFAASTATTTTTTTTNPSAGPDFISTIDSMGPQEVKELGSFEAAQPIEVWFVALASIPDQNNAAARVPGEAEPARMAVPYMFTGDDFGSLRTRRFGEVPCSKGEGAGKGKEEEEEGEDGGFDLRESIVRDVDDRARHHTAGVTSILPLPVDPGPGGAPWLLTGSYDEMLRVYCATGVGRERAKVVAELGLGGGVWRLQLVNVVDMGAGGSLDRERRRFLVLASCMHAGTRVLEITWEQSGTDEPEVGMQVLAEFTEHESMNYASDVWKPEGWSWDGKKNGEERALCVSSSFYDRRVCVWRLDVGE